MSEGSFRSLLREYAEGGSERLFSYDTRVFAFSEISVASLSGREGGTLSGSLEGASFTGLLEVLSSCLSLSAVRCVCSCKSSSTGTAEGPELSGEMIVALGCTFSCLLSSEGLLRRGDWSPRGEIVAPVWLDVDGLSRSDTDVTAGVSETALAGDLGVRERMDSRPGATLGLMENRFLL